MKFMADHQKLFLILWQHNSEFRRNKQDEPFHKEWRNQIFWDFPSIMYGPGLERQQITPETKLIKVLSDVTFSRHALLTYADWAMPLPHAISTYVTEFFNIKMGHHVVSYKVQAIEKCWLGDGDASGSVTTTCT